MIGIYCIRNLTNGKRYIGQSKNIPIRLTQHFSDLRAGRHRNEVLQRAWDKYGEASFVREILCECEVHELDTQERFYIESLSSDRHANGYNIEIGGQVNRPMKEETKKKLSIANLGKKMSEEFKKNQSIRMTGKYVGEKNPNWGKKLTPEHIDKLKEGRKRHGITEHERELRRAAATNISDETRKKRSIALSGEKNPMFGKFGSLAPFFGKHHTEETKRKTSERFKGKKVSPEVVEKCRASRQGKPRSKKTSIYVGVSKNQYGKWSAYITYMGKSKNLGSFELEIDAAIAYNHAALEIYGESAKTNKFYGDK